MQNSQKLKDFSLKGFTLVELSIVLVVIALLIAGILAGQDVLTATKRNSIITEVNQFRTAISNFRTKYFNNLPGDFDEAEKFWTSTLTTDGDGDGRVDKTASTPGESLLVWQHLNLAQMLPGNYTGAMATGDLMVPDENVPGGDYSKDLGYNMMYSTGLPDITSSFPAYQNNFILAGGCSAQEIDSTEACVGGILTPSNSESIDIKIDDGSAISGKVLAYESYDAINGCSTTWDDPTSQDYNLSTETADCVLFFNFKEFN